MSDSFATFTPTEAIDPKNPYKLPDKVGSNWSLKGWLFQLQEAQKRLTDDIANLQNAIGQIKDDQGDVKEAMQKQITTMQDTLNNINEQISHIQQTMADNTANGDTSDIDPSTISSKFGLPIERYKLDFGDTLNTDKRGFHFSPYLDNDNAVSVIKLNEKYALYHFDFNFMMNLSYVMDQPRTRAINVMPFVSYENLKYEAPEKQTNSEGYVQKPLYGYVWNADNAALSAVGKSAIFNISNDIEGHFAIRLFALDYTALKDTTTKLYIRLNQTILGVYNG